MADLLIMLALGAGILLWVLLGGVLPWSCLRCRKLFCVEWRKEAGVSWVRVCPHCGRVRA